MRELVTHGGLEPPASRSQTERDAITPMSDETRLRLGGFEQGFAVGILPMNRLPGSPRLRASAAILYLDVCVITDDGRLERWKRSYGFSEMVRKTGFDPVASCTPSTCSAWLSYFLMKWARRKTR